MIALELSTLYVLLRAKLIFVLTEFIVSEYDSIQFSLSFSASFWKAMLEVEVHPDQAMDENQEIHGAEGSGNRRLASESTPVEQGQDFATSTETLDREEMSELWQLEDLPQTTPRWQA